MFSEELYELDKNTVKFMMDEMQEEIDGLQETVDGLREQIANKDDVIAALQQQLERMKVQ
jgi:peptidoglycan hydrolase CwlO-like protein